MPKFLIKAKPGRRALLYLTHEAQNYVLTLQMVACLAELVALGLIGMFSVLRLFKADKFLPFSAGLPPTVISHLSMAVLAGVEALVIEQAFLQLWPAHADSVSHIFILSGCGPCVPNSMPYLGTSVVYKAAQAHLHCRNGTG